MAIGPLKCIGIAFAAPLAKPQVLTNPRSNMQHSASRVFKRTFLSVALSATMLPPVFAAGLTRVNGSLVGDNQNSETAGPEGPVLLQDSHLVEKLQRFDRERIPERVVHAR